MLSMSKHVNDVFNSLLTYDIRTARMLKMLVLV